MIASILQRVVYTAGMGIALWPLSAAPGAREVDPLLVPAELSPLALHTQLLAVENTGVGWVAAGWRGHILLAASVDSGWTQAQVPVSVDLTALSFPNTRTGWAVGHGGVVLKTMDGGSTWQRELDGMAVAELMTGYYRPLADAGDEAAVQALTEIEINTAEGPELPWLDVDFQDEQHGLVVGSFNMILETRDGGHSWRPLLDQMDNPEALHLNSVTTVGEDIYIASERGVVFKRDKHDGGGRFRKLDTGYEGSWFGVVGNASVLLAYGLRGTLYRSADGGMHWQPLDSGTAASLTGAATLDDGRMLLVSQGGDVLLVNADALSVTTLAAAMGTRFAGVTGMGSQVLVVGTQGVQVITP